MSIRILTSIRVLTRLLLILTLCLMFSLANYPGNVFAETTYWPTEGWRVSSPEQQGMSSAPLIDMLETIVEDGVDVDSISIIRNGYLVADIYMYPFGKGQKHIIHSCTKSFTSTLVGIAIDKGYLSNTSTKLVDYFPERSIQHNDARKRSITLENLLTMSAGMDTRDNWKDYGWQGMYEMFKTDDWTQYGLDRPMAHKPGQKFEYSNIVSFLLTAILQKKTQQDANQFAQQYLFDPLGIKDTMWRKSPQNIYTGYGELWLTPHDMAKLGFLYLNKGLWQDKRILSEKWVQLATEGQITVSPTLAYGYQWWVTGKFYFAMGYQGQFIIVVPEKEMVVVFTSNLMGQSIFTPIEYLKKYIIPAVQSDFAIPTDEKSYKKLKKLTNDLLVKSYYEIQITQ